MDFTFLDANGKVIEIQYVDAFEDASIDSTDDVDVQSRQYINRAEEPLTCHFSVHKEFTDSTYFTENKRITTTKNVSPKLSIKLFKIVTTSLGFEFGTEEVLQI